MICRILTLNLTQSSFIHPFDPRTTAQKGFECDPNRVPCLIIKESTLMQASHLRFYFPFSFFTKFISYVDFVDFVVNFNLNIDKGLT